MAITFPRAWPSDLPIVGLSFPPDPMIEVTPLRSGRQVSVNIGPTLWRAKYSSAPLTGAQFGAARAWYDTILSAEAFYGYDLSRAYPLAYEGGWPDTFTGFDGTCLLTDVNVNNKVISLANLPVGFKLSPGDYLSFDYSESRALHRVSAQGVADGDGLLDIEVRPHIRPGATTSPATSVQLYRPSAAFIILPNTYDETIDGDGFGRISFEAIQTL